jgi:hypothetical protein
VAPLFDGGRRSVAYVLFEELLYGVVGFGGSSTSLPRGKGLSLIGKPDVALDRGEADAEEAGSMGLGHAALVDGLDYLSSEVFGVGFHPPMIVRGSSILSYAVDALSALRIREEDALKIASALRAPCCARRSCSALRLCMRGFLFIEVFLPPS